MRRMSPIALLFLLLVGTLAAFYIHEQRSGATAGIGVPTGGALTSPSGSRNTSAYLYYTLKQSDGFVLARALKGDNDQPLSAPHPIAHFTDEFGLEESDSVLTMQLSPDGRYLAIDGTRDHGEQVWMYDTQGMTISLTPANVLGNFLHWLPGATGHTFLYRPMFPMGPSAPMDNGGWNPGLWEVDAATGEHINIDMLVPSAYLVDAAPSPDGSRIIYSTTAGLGMGSDTWLINRDGSGRTHLFSNPRGAQSIAGLFTWSPDSTTIAYERLSDSPTPFQPAGLWVMNNRGGQQRRLADTDGGHGYIPVWSPDGRKIAFVVRTNEGNRQADTQMSALQSAIAVVSIVDGQSWIVASANQTGMQINVNPSWTAASASITFTAIDPTNAAPRYWSARVTRPQTRPSVSPLTPAMSNVVAIGSS